MNRMVCAVNGPVLSEDDTSGIFWPSIDGVSSVDGGSLGTSGGSGLTISGGDGTEITFGSACASLLELELALSEISGRSCANMVTWSLHECAGLTNCR